MVPAGRIDLEMWNEIGDLGLKWYEWSEDSFC